MSVDRRPTRLALAVYVCADPGVPVFGTKGSSVHVRAVLAELARRADEVHLLTTRPGGVPDGALAGARVHRLPGTGRAAGDDPARREAALVAADAAVADRLDEVVGDRTPDVVYERYSLWSCAAMERAARRGWPSVLEVNAPLVDEHARHRGLVDRRTAEDRTARALRAATLPVAVSTEVAAWAERWAGREVTVVPNGVDPARFGATRLGPSRPRRDTVTIGFVGTYKPWHDLDALVAAVAHVATTGARPRVLLVGDGPERPRLLARLAALGLGDAVEPVGAVPAERIPALLAEVDVALAPYGPDEQYFSPLKVFEYLAAGTAVVASGIRGLDGLVADGHELVLVPPGDRDGFARAVGRLCADPAARHALGRAGREAARARLGWDRVVDRILAGLALGTAA